MVGVDPKRLLRAVPSWGPWSAPSSRASNRLAGTAMLKKLCFYWRSFWRWSKWFLRWWSKKGLVGQRSERKPWVSLLYIGDTDTTQLLYRDHKKAAFFSHPPFFGVKKHNSRFFFHNLTNSYQNPSSSKIFFPEFFDTPRPSVQSSLMGISGPIPSMPPFFQEIAGL